MRLRTTTVAACAALPGPTDHNSTIITIPNGLEDQLPAPLVTKDNVNDQSLWANQLGKS
jgi:ribose transport system substrate-binding protein